MERREPEGRAAQQGAGPEPDSRVARAEAAIHAIAAGADPGAEALNVSNRYTDDLTARVRGLLGRRKRRDGPAAGPE